MIRLPLPVGFTADAFRQGIVPEVMETIRDIIVRNMSAFSGVGDLTAVAPAEAAESYLPGFGFTTGEIAFLKAAFS